MQSLIVLLTNHILFNFKVHRTLKVHKLIQKALLKKLKLISHVTPENVKV